MDYDIDLECPKCSATMKIESASEFDSKTVVELYCFSCGCMIEEEVE